MISYSQNFEDVILNRCFSHKTDGFYIDIGAADPDICSCTKHFYQQGWRGINIDPQARKIALFSQKRPRDININMAVSDNNNLQKFYEVEDKAFALSSLHYKYIEKLTTLNIKHKVKMVPGITLDQIVEQYHVTDCDFINIDCEGNEKQVLLGWKNTHFTPIIVLIESIEPMLSPNENRIETHLNWEYILLNKDYRFVYADGINRFYLHSSRLDLIEKFTFPPNALDGFNVITQKIMIKISKKIKNYFNKIYRILLEDAK